MAPPPAEPRVRFFSPMPKDYQFVPKGDVYVTANVRKRTHAVGATLYVVVDKNKKPIGIRCPTKIHEEVNADAEASAAHRATAVKSRDAAVEHEFKAELLRLYPKMPQESVRNILQQALEKRRRRVGRTTKLDIKTKVQLAVVAHIRHRHTRYEELLKTGTGRDKARRLVADESKRVALSWMCSRSKQPSSLIDDDPGAKKRKRKTHNSQPAPRKRRTKHRSAQMKVTTEPETSDSEADTDSEGGVSNDLSVFDDDPNDSDWIP